MLTPTSVHEIDGFATCSDPSISQPNILPKKINTKKKRKKKHNFSMIAEWSIYDHWWLKTAENLVKVAPLQPATLRGRIWGGVKNQVRVREGSKPVVNKTKKKNTNSDNGLSSADFYFFAFLPRRRGDLPSEACKPSWHVLNSAGKRCPTHRPFHHGRRPPHVASETPGFLFSSQLARRDTSSSRETTYAIQQSKGGPWPWRQKRK